MMKLILLILVAFGWFAGSKAFMPGLWSPMTWHIPFTDIMGSWGLILLVVLVYCAHKAIK